MVADPRWLEILKASGGQSAAVAAACGSLLLANRWGWVPTLDPWMVIAAAFGLVLSGCLALVSAVTSVWKVFPADKWVVYRLKLWRQARRAEEYIPHMTKKEQDIIGYLLKHNQKMFTGAVDGGHAVTLISRGIIVRAMVSGQQASAFDVPFMIPDHIWNGLLKNKDKIKYTPELNRGTEVSPWRERVW
jgi:hypothetical protein